jgi:hypothetical protein
MAITILDPTVAAAVAAATSQEAQRAALLAPFGSADVTVRALNSATLRETMTYGAWVTDSLTPRGATLGPLLARSVASTGAPSSFVFRAGSLDVFSMTGGVSPEAADIVLVSGISVSARTNLSDGSMSKVTVTANPALAVTDAVATAFALTISSTSGTNGIAVTLTVTPNGPIPPGGASVTLAASNGGTLGTTSLSFTSGSVGSLGTTLTRSTAGTSTVTMTNNKGLSNNGSPVSFTSVAPAAVGPTLATLTLTGSDGASKPFTVGHAFKKGHIPAGASILLSGTSVSAQSTIKSTWPDGSAKIAVLAGTATISGGTAALTVSSGPAATGTVLTTADLIATGATAVVDAGAFGAASFGDTEWAAPFQAWISGPRMSSWVYRKPVGSDAHLVAWLEVRLYAGGQVEVLPWVENGYITVAGPTNKSDTYTFTLGGTSMFSAAIDLKHHQRTPLVSGTALSYWLGSDPAIVPLHDAAYLQSTELVPTYFAAMSAGSGRMTAQPTSFTPLQAGSLVYDSDNMASAGYQHPIGLLPEHDVLHLVAHASDRQTTYRSVVWNGYSGGRYGIHYRDESTNRPLRFSQHPTLNIRSGQGFKDTGGSTGSNYTPVVSGGNPPQWDVAHSPNLGYMAYLLTGRFYFMEEVLFVATVNYLGNGDNSQLRTGSQGLVQTATQAWQTRSCAWDWRSRIMALTVVPDDDTTLRTELISCVESNIAHFHGRYVAQANNPFGLILPGEDAYSGGVDEVAIWQQDFVTAAFGWAVSLDLPIGTTPKSNLSAFFQWKAQSVTMRLEASSGWWYINGAPYTIKVGGSVNQNSYKNGTGPWPADPSAVYALTYASPPAWLGSTEGTLAFDFQPNYDAGVKGVWGNLQPALAYAVRHGVTGALEGYTRMVEANNWSTFETAFASRPVWSVKPSAGLLPAWLQDKPLNSWFSIPGTTGAGGASVDAYSGFGLREDTSELFVMCAGGHLDSSDNRVTSINLMDDAPTWLLRGETIPAALDGNASAGADRLMNVTHYLDGRPTSRHTYWNNFWMPELNRMISVGVRGEYAGATAGGTAIDGFNPDTNRWDAAGTWPDTAGADIIGIGKDGFGDVWTAPLRHKFSHDGLYTNPSTSGSFPGWRGPARWDANAQRLVVIQFGDGFGYGTPVINITRMNPLSGVGEAISIADSAAKTQFIADAPLNAGCDYCPDNGKFMFIDGRSGKQGRFYWITPNSGTTWDMEIATFAAGSASLPAVGNAGTLSKFLYIPRLKGFVFMPTSGAGLYFLRTA